MTPSSLQRHHHVEHAMGTVFSIDIRSDVQSDVHTDVHTDVDWTDAVTEAVAFLHHVDDVFSTYRPDSDISRIARRELRAADADPLVADVLHLCAMLYGETDGWFSAIRGGRLDPTGLVKGWAVEQASTILRRHGAHHHLINGGGDIQAVGSPAPGKAWSIGIADPRHRDQVLTTVAGHDFAVATSGSAERGAHITNPFTDRPATALLSATVTGPSLTRADVYATACVAMGEQASTWIKSVPDYQCLLIRADGTTVTSADWDDTGARP